MRTQAPVNVTPFDCAPVAAKIREAEAFLSDSAEWILQKREAQRILVLWNMNNDGRLLVSVSRRGYTIRSTCGRVELAGAHFAPLLRSLESEFVRWFPSKKVFVVRPKAL